MDVVLFIAGFIIGVIAVGLAIELGMKKSSRTLPASRPTHRWNISEISNPRIIAENLGNMELPKNAKVVVNQVENKDILQGLDVKTHTGIRGNFILGEDRALVLSGSIKNDALGVWTVEKVMLDKLNQYFEDSWSKASKINVDEEK